MKKFFISIVVLIALVIIAKLSLNDTLPSYSVHYKVTVEIETPEGIKSGSSVWELSVATPLIKSPDSGNPANRRGEAVVVDLGKRGVVFALLSDQSWQNGLYQAFPTEAPSSKRGIEYYEKTLKIGMKGEWEEYIPKLVMFKDLEDPKSVTLVYINNLYADGTHIFENYFEEIFGTGVKLKGITVEITDEPVTWGMVDKFLPTDYDLIIRRGWRQLSEQEKKRLVNLTKFRLGE